MYQKLNLACNIKVVEKDEKYRHIQNYLFFRTLTGAIQQNHQTLIVDLASLQDLDFNTDQTSIFEKRSRVQISLQNLLNSHKFFQDVLKRNHEKSEPKMYARFKMVANYYYDQDFNYRIFEVLRNYCQHANTVPIDIFSDFEGASYIFINKQELSKDTQAFKKIKGELESPLDMELNSIVEEWISSALHVYGLVLDYFAHKSKSVVNDYLGQLNTNTMALRDDPSSIEIKRSVEIKIIKTRMLFPVLPDPNLLCSEIISRFSSTGYDARHSEIKRIICQERSSRNSSRRMKKLGVSFDFPKFDTLFLKNINKFLNGEDPF